MGEFGMNAVEEMMDLRRVATALSINPRTVWRLVAAKALAKPVRIGRSVRWFESDVAAYQGKLREERGE